MPSVAPVRFEPNRFATGAALVAATYVYFLLFAQFAFLAVTRTAAPDALTLVLGAQGIAGVSGSVLAAICFTSARSRGLLTTGLLLCSAAAGLAPFADGTLALVFVATLTGLALGVTTVTLASSLLGIVGSTQLGLVCGLGTGLAYALCTIPPVFAAAPGIQSLLAAVAALAGAGVTWLLPMRSEHQPAPAVSLDHQRRNVAAWLLIFLALVGFDSAAFYIIQNTPELKAAAWSDGLWPYVAAGAQLSAAVVAGVMLSRSRRGMVVLIAIVLLAGACLLLIRPAGWISVLYAAGAAFYSTALVHYPARVARPRLAALIYAVCGWGGSALGLGLAQGRTAVPVWWVLAVTGMIGLALTALRRNRPVGLSSNR